MTTAKIVRHDEGIIYDSNPAELLTLKLTSADTNHQIDYGQATIHYLGGPPLHIHNDQDEFFHVLEGELRVQIGAEMVDLGAGDMAYCPRGVAHTFANLHRKPVRMIGFALGGGFDRFYAEMAAAAPIRPDPAQLAEIAARHNIQIVGPPLPVALGLVEHPPVAA